MVLRTAIATLLMTIFTSSAQSQQRGIHDGIADADIGNSITETLSNIRGCESHDMFREIFQNVPNAGSQTRVSVNWSSAARQIGEFNFVNSVAAECTSQELTGHSCRYGGSSSALQGNVEVHPSSRRWSVDRLARENGRIVPSGLRVVLSYYENGSSISRTFNGENARALHRAVASLPGSYRGTNNILTYTWGHFDTIGQIAIRIRNEIGCQDNGESCTLDIRQEFYMRYSERDVCGSDGPNLPNP